MSKRSVIFAAICLFTFVYLMSLKTRPHRYADPVVKKVALQYGMASENLSAIILSLEKERSSYLESQDLFY